MSPSGLLTLPSPKGKEVWVLGEVLTSAPGFARPGQVAAPLGAASFDRSSQKTSPRGIRGGGRDSAGSWKEGVRNGGGAARNSVSTYSPASAQTLGRSGGSIVRLRPRGAGASGEVLLPPAGSFQEHRHLVEFAVAFSSHSSYPVPSYSPKSFI